MLKTEPVPNRSAELDHDHCDGATSYLGHLLLSLSFGRLRVSIVVGLNQNEVIRLLVDHKFPGSALQRKCHLIEDGPQFLQSQDSAHRKE